MAFFQLVVKAHKVRRARRVYHEEKLRSVVISRGGEAGLSFRQRIRHKKYAMKRWLRKNLLRFVCCSEHSWCYQRVVMLGTDGSLENYLLKSFLGFLGGVLLTYMFFVFFVFQLHLSLASATLLCSGLGGFLSVGLAFSPRIRCLVFLFLPQFCTKRGRQALMAYALVLALTGPMKNTIHNLGILCESLACGQEQLKEAVKALLDMMKRPFYALRDSLAKIIRSMRAVVRRIKRILVRIKRLVLGILAVIESVFQWLGSIVNLCNKNLGTPYERCSRVFDEALADCRARLGPVLGVACDVTSVAGSVCYLLKPLDLMCILVSHVSDAIVGVVRDRVKKFVTEMKAMFYVKIRFSHTFEFHTEKSKSLSEISSGIAREVKRKSDRIFAFLDWTSLLASIFFLILSLRVVYYRHKWLSKDRFDNLYISGHLREIDWQRAKMDKETIFPLNARERIKYVAVTSVILAGRERARLLRSLLFLANTCLKLVVYILVDYCLFWLLDKIRFYGRVESKVDRPSYSGTVTVRGNGFLAELYRSLARTFTAEVDDSRLERLPCLPEPRPPNYDGYTQIATLALFAWIIAIFEPYCLRLRHVVMSNYYPDRAKQRAVWLYNHILRSRGSFLKYARRQLRRKFGTTDSGEIEKVTFRERIWALLPFLQRLMPLKEAAKCVMCGTPERGQSAPHIRCPTPGCPGIFCSDCFQDLHKLCTICLSPLDYGDLTDFSEERDSSDDQSRRPRKPLIDAGIADQKPHRQAGAGDNREWDKDKSDSVEGRGVTFNEQEVKESQQKGDKSNIIQDTSDDENSSKYSYSYQYEPPQRDELITHRVKFKDVEAQTIRDDVTMQIFRNSASEEMASSSEEVSYMGLTNRKSKRKSSTKLNNRDSTSIADTESWTTDKFTSEDEQQLEIEEFNSHYTFSDEELLPKKSLNKGKAHLPKFKQFIKSLKSIFHFQKKKEKNTIPLETKDNTSSTETDYEEYKSETENASNDDNSSVHDQKYEPLIRSNIERKKSRNATEYSLRKRCTTSSINNDSDKKVCTCKKSLINQNKYDTALYPHLMKFETKELPRYLKKTCSNVKFYVMDESSSCESARNTCQSDRKLMSRIESWSSVDSNLSRDRRSSTWDVDNNDSYIYTSDNNSDKRYDTFSHTSELATPDDLNWSTDTSDCQKMSCGTVSTKTFLNEKVFNNEEKIQEDSDEKGQNRKYEKIADHAEFGINSDNRLEANEHKSDIRLSDLSNVSYKSSNTTVTSNDKSLMKYKVEKETANEKKKQFLTQEMEKIQDRKRLQDAKKQKILFGFHPIIYNKDRDERSAISSGTNAEFSQLSKTQQSVTKENDVSGPISGGMNDSP